MASLFWLPDVREHSDITLVLFYQSTQSRLITAVGKLIVAHLVNECLAFYGTRRSLPSLQYLTNLTPLSESASELYRPGDRRLSAK
jgi:hypothetical protein